MNYHILINKNNKIPDNFNINLVNAKSNYKEGILIEKKVLKNFKLLQYEALK